MGTMKGLPLAYSKDMQDDKPPVFEAYDLLALTIAAMTGTIDEIAFVPERLRVAAAGGLSTATDLAAWLVRAAGAPFRAAHHITGLAGKARAAPGVLVSVLARTSGRERGCR